MRVLVVGATGGSGRAAVKELVEQGHEVTAFARGSGALRTLPGPRTVVGDATEPADVDAAVAGQDAVVITLGIAENPLRVRLRGPRATPRDVRSRGTRTVVDAMLRRGVRTLVVQTSYGVGPTRERLPRRYQAMFRLLLGPQISDTERQEDVVRASGLDWVLVQPVNLVDDPAARDAFVTSDGSTRGWHVSRAGVGRVLADAVAAPSYVGHTLAVS